MTEDFLHFVWKYKLFDLTNLRTSDDEQLEIIKSGFHNTDAGPDFFDARLKIGKTLWAGNIEVHKRSSDWIKHKHTSDKSYDSTILHVVFENDDNVYLTNGSKLPTLELKNKIESSLLNKYNRLAETLHEIPCSNTIKAVDPFVINTWLQRVIIERLENKTHLIKQELERNKGDWEETFYQFVASSFGFKVNSEPFVQLAHSISNNLYSKHKNNQLKIEALLFGQAGFLNENFNDDYPQQLQKEYKFLAHKYGLTSIDKHQWKFLRLRPANFPTVRLAQFADLVYQSNHLFSKILNTSESKKLKQLFEVKANDYWTDHYQFDKQSKKSVKKIGENAIQSILINVVVPFLFLYGKQKDNAEYIDRAFCLLEYLPSELNKITKLFAEIGVKPQNAAQSQSLIELKKFYCDQKKCLNCSIGIKILNNVTTNHLLL